MNYLLDTCVISEYTRREPNVKIIRWNVISPASASKTSRRPLALEGRPKRAAGWPLQLS